MSLFAVAYRIEHFAMFEPGEAEHALFAADGRQWWAEAMAEQPTLTVFRGPQVEAFVGVRDGKAWSMWSRQARRHPFRLCRFIARNLNGWLAEYGFGRVEVLCETPAEMRFAERLGFVFQEAA